MSTAASLWVSQQELLICCSHLDWDFTVCVMHGLFKYWHLPYSSIHLPHQMGHVLSRNSAAPDKSRDAWKCCWSLLPCVNGSRSRPWLTNTSCQRILKHCIGTKAGYLTKCLKQRQHLTCARAFWCRQGCQGVIQPMCRIQLHLRSCSHVNYTASTSPFVQAKRVRTNRTRSFTRCYTLSVCIQFLLPEVQVCKSTKLTPAVLCERNCCAAFPWKDPDSLPCPHT